MSNAWDWADFKLELVDGATLHTVDHLDDLYEGTFDLALYGYGDACSISLRMESTIVSQLLTGGNWFFKLWLGSTHLRDYMLAEDKRGYTRQGDDNQYYVEFTLEPLDKILSWRHCEPETAGDTLTTPSLTVDDAFKWIVDHCIGPSAYADPDGGSRALTGFTVEADASAHGTTRVFTEASRKNLFAFLQSYGAYYGVDWQVWLETTTAPDNQFVFRTYTPRRGLDKTSDNGARAPVVLNDASTNILTASYTRDYRFVNAVISKSGAAQVTNAGSITTYGRREFVADENGTVALNAILNEKGQRTGYEFEFEGSPNCMPLVDFVPGDLVTANNLYMGVAAGDQTVRSIQLHKQTDGQVAVTLVLGDYQRDLKDDINDAAGGGGGSDGWYDPILMCEADDTNRSPFSDEDPAILYVTGGTGISTTATTAENRITISLDVHDILSLHSYTGGAALDVVGLSAASTLGMLTPSYVPGAASKILKTSSAGYLRIERLYLTDIFNYVGKLGDDLLVFTATGNLVMVTAGHVYPSVDTVSLGTASYKWYELHLKGDANIRDLTYVWPAAHASGALLNNGSGTLSWGAPSVTVDRLTSGSLYVIFDGSNLYPSGSGHSVSVGSDTNKFVNGYFSGSLVVAGNVDGVDVSAFKSAYDAHDHGGSTGSYSSSNAVCTDSSSYPGTAIRVWVETGGGAWAYVYARGGTHDHDISAP